MASSPSVAPTVRCSTVSTGTGSAPARTSSASSSASAWVKLPVIDVRPPTMPTPQRTSSFDLRRGDHLAVQHDRDATGRVTGRGAGARAR